MVPFYGCFNNMTFLMQMFINEFPNQKTKKRKERNSDSHDKMIYSSQPPAACKEAPSFTSFQKGSMTVEAAFVLPLFLFAVLAMIYLLEIMAIQTNIRAGMQYAGKRYAENAYLTAFAHKETLEKDIVESIGESRINTSVIRGGSAGIDCSASYLDPIRQILFLKTKYTMKIPIPVFGIFDIKKEETMRIKGWNGYTSSIPTSPEQRIVYVTEHGTVYHLDQHCTYLDLSVRMVSQSELETLRNQSGGKYYPCDKCGGQAGWGVYVTDYGDRYHTSLSCSGLKRKVYAVPISETAGKGVCSKCGNS